MASRVPDQMHKIRAQIAMLEAKYVRLRQRVLDGKASATGRNWQAIVHTHDVATLRRQDLAEIDPKLHSALVRWTERTVVRLKAIT